jgi:hypothetical protein
MKSLQSTHSAVAEQHSKAPPKLKPFKLQTPKMSSGVRKGLLSLVAIASVLSIAPKALADLSFGDTGSEVRNLQIALGISPDGVFGRDTESAVLRFQRQCGLEVDGIAGTQTLSALASNSCLADGFQPIRPGDSLSEGPYVVAVPGSSNDRLSAVRQVVPGAVLDDSGRGSFINAGGYRSRSDADAISDRLKDLGLPARIDFRP